MVNLSSFIRFHATRSPHRLALIYEGQRISYAQFYQRILRMAAFLRAEDIGEQDVVAVFMKNSAAFLDIAFAVSHLGAVFLPINFRLAREECRYTLDNAGVTRVFHDADLSSVAGGLPGAIEVSDAAARDSGALTGAARPIPGLVVRQPGDVFRLMYTSGTTDHPKGVVHTYSNFYWKSMDHVISLGLSAEDRLLVVGPLYHVGAFDLPGIAVLWLGRDDGPA